MVNFTDLFTGSDQSYGQYSPATGARTMSGLAPSPAEYQTHLDGRMGLGIVPVGLDGTCRFGALDIDVDTIDHKALWVKVKHRELPLTVCRSRSGAAHLYVFFDKPTPAPVVQKLLREWSGLLGYPSCEIFPKQTSIQRYNPKTPDKTDLGSWINLPYFGGDSTTRYAVNQDGPLTLAQFLAQVEYYDPKKKINRELPQLDEGSMSQMPPCLEALLRNGLPEGNRNTGLLNFGVYFRKAYPNDWEARVRDLNKNQVKPPLEDRELETTVLKSLNRTKYSYLCHEEPISSRCDRQACLKREFGINHRVNQEKGFYDEVAVYNLRKFDTVPPRYRVEVNGVDLEFASEELRNYTTGFKPMVFERLNLLLRPIKQDMWDRQLRELLTTLKVIEVPEDASWQGVVLVKVWEFLALADRSRKQEDILKGLPWRDTTGSDNGIVMPVVWFRVSDLQRYLTSAKITIETQRLYTLLEEDGGRYRDTTIKGKKVNLWGIPDAEGTRQTEPFTPPAEPAKSEEML